MLLVRGPSIFNGYLNYDGPDPFTEVDGKRWYVTGDLVRLDEDGYIHFCGRLKRFLKIGGEMVSLPALEEPLASFIRRRRTARRWRSKASMPPARWIVLFTTRDISLKQANAILAQAGFARRDAAGCRRADRGDPRARHRQDGLQGAAEAGGGKGLRRNP